MGVNSKNLNDRKYFRYKENYYKALTTTGSVSTVPCSLNKLVIGSNVNASVISLYDANNTPECVILTISASASQAPIVYDLNVATNTGLYVGVLGTNASLTFIFKSRDTI